MDRPSRIDRPTPTLELYARAAAGAVLPNRIWGGGTALPELVLERTLVAKPDDLADYNAVCGFATTRFLPLTYPHVLGFPLRMRLMTGRDFPLPVLGLVHVANSITVHEQVPADAELTIRVRAEGPYLHRRGTEVDLVTQAAVSGAVVWEESSTYLGRGSKLAEQARAPARPAVDWPEPPATAHVREVRIAEDIGRRYGAVSGDQNPIHLHPLTARAFGFKRAIAHGMWVLANSLAVVGLPYDPPYRVATAFRRPVLLPCTAHLRTATVDGQLRVWLTGSAADEVHAAITVDRAPA